VTETIARIVTIAAALIIAAYYGLLLALAAFTDFGLGGPRWALLCVLMGVFAIWMLATEIEEWRGARRVSSRAPAV
jgi:hypothetical protein